MKAAEGTVFKEAAHRDAGPEYEERNPSGNGSRYTLK